MFVLSVKIRDVTVGDDLMGLPLGALSLMLSTVAAFSGGSLGH